MQQVNAGLTRFLVGSGGQNDQTAVLEILIITGVHGTGLGKRDTVADVGGFPFGLGAVDIEQDQLGKQTARRQCVSGCRTDKTGADHRTFLQIHRHPSNVCSMSDCLWFDGWKNLFCQQQRACDTMEKKNRTRRNFSA